MKPGLIGILAILLTHPAVPQQRVATGSIEGRVRRTGDEEPIAGAKIVLTRTASEGGGSANSSAASAEISVITDSEGRFAIRNVPIGSYRLAASRSGYIGRSYGQRGRSGNGVAFNLAAGQEMKDVAFLLTRQGSINGRIRSDNGEPVEGVTVQLQRYGYTPDGRRILDTVKSATTTDRGEYRLYWIDPGRYYLLVSGRDNRQSFKIDDVAYTPTYYGSVVDPGEALAIDIHSGEDLEAIDVALSQQQHRVYRISGTIVDSATGLPPTFAQVGLTRLLPGGEFRGDQRPSYFNSSKGTFEITDLIPGTYWVSTQVLERSPGGATGTTTSETGNIGAVVDVSNRDLTRGAQVKVNLLDADVDNLVLNAAGGTSIKGHLTIEGQSIPDAASGHGIRVELTGHPAANSPSESPNVGRDGTFVIRSVPAGEYRVKIRGVPSAYYIKDAHLGSEGVLGETISIRGQVTATLEVVLSFSPGTITGTVIDSQSKGVSGAQVVLIPDRQRDRLDLYKTVTTDSGGKFSIGSIAPGDYRIFSWEDLDAYAYFDPGIVREAEPLGRLVHVSEASKETVEVRIIPAQ